MYALTGWAILRDRHCCPKLIRFWRQLCSDVSLCQVRGSGLRTVGLQRYLIVELCSSFPASTIPDWSSQYSLKMSESKARIVRSLAQTLFPRLEEEAGLARAAGQEGMAALLETSASSMDFVIDAVSFECSAPNKTRCCVDLTKALEQDGCQLPVGSQAAAAVTDSITASSVCHALLSPVRYMGSYIITESMPVSGAGQHEDIDT